jgi:hypothetical protein
VTSPLEITHGEMNAAIDQGHAVPLSLGQGWLIRYRDDWWIEWEKGWLRVNDDKDARPVGESESGGQVHPAQRRPPGAMTTRDGSSARRRGPGTLPGQNRCAEALEPRTRGLRVRYSEALFGKLESQEIDDMRSRTATPRGTVTWGGTLQIRPPSAMMPGFSPSTSIQTFSLGCYGRDARAIGSPSKGSLIARDPACAGNSSVQVRGVGSVGPGLGFVALCGPGTAMATRSSRHDVRLC